MTQKQYLDPTRVTLVRHVITSEGKRQWQKKDYYDDNWLATENNPYEVKFLSTKLHGKFRIGETACEFTPEIVSSTLK